MQLQTQVFVVSVEGWKGLGLAKEQTAEFVKIHNRYASRISDKEDTKAHFYQNG
jgi:hypothetical protein